MYALYTGKKMIGYMSLSKEEEDSYELHNLAILPEYRHNGFGRQMVEFAKEKVKSFGGKKMKIGIIEESTVFGKLVHSKWICTNWYKEI